MAKILIIEDEDGIANFVKEGLTEENFHVSIANTGTEGLQLLKLESFDLILLDWMLPGISGLEICKIYRKENTATPIIFLTAKDTIQDTIAGLQSGANDYIKKPFHFDELIERIKVQLRNVSNIHSILQLKDISMDIDAHKVTKSGLEVPLTQKEFALLEHLLQNKGKVCSRNQIIEQVWDIHFEYDTGIIDVYINGLRKKLGFTKTEDYIQTVRGVGYMIVE
ncbi:DNA-binding response regulator, OmpR family, contains REC and winged-helix (wHTH) domain [Pustulibacterium marinum]|uniref:DNA-binding response regulator, OmpR family, contains REC and winged-helix (WHTH) domain n=1 Tax=Pustulibacterium marinum TaxID=1224947 RepID=A0A1I7FU31_9FLAO|nr:response regulator transcription factor [Pustulibacterium marinum]SFU39660.1 DNA-binding response regulator, OmpR family, contains REC and winged-helix (wHTH) domain [Pustulibacterium marinum]